MRLRWALPLLLLLGSGTARADVALPAPGMLKADGEITGLTRAGDRFVLTGTFRHIGLYVGGAVGLDAASGARDPGFARLDGQVSDAVPDGKGGWYAAGQFLVAGRQRSVAHVLPSGALDPDFDATLTGFATALVLDGDRLYVGRWFGNARLVLLDAASGKRDLGFKQGDVAPVTELLLTGDRLYAGTTNGVGAFSPTTGSRVTAFSCGFCEGQVTALAVHGGTLYAGFRELGVVGLDLDTGRRIATFAPTPNTVTGNAQDRGPLVLMVDGDRLLVGGRGLRLGGPSSTLAALDLTTGAADPAFGRGFVNPIHDWIDEGDTLLVGGAPLDDRPAPLIRIDRATGAYQGALVPKLDGPIDALAGGGHRLFVGGRFATAQSMATDGVAEVDRRSGRLITSFAVHGMPADALGTAPVVAGDSLVFPYESGNAFVVARAVAFSARTGAPMAAFAPRAIRYRNYSYRGARWAADHGRVYAVYATGPGTDMWPRSSVAVLSAHSGARIAHYRLPYDGYVEDVLAQRGQLFVAGSFLRSWPDGRPRNLATMAIDPLTGAVDDGFDAHTNGPVVSVQGFRDRLYLAGYYDRAYGLAAPHGFSSAYDNTGAIVAGFNRHLFGVFDTGGTLLGASFAARAGGVDPYTGERRTIVPKIGQVYGYPDSMLLSPRGAYVTVTLDLPYDEYSGLYDDYAVLLPYEQ